MICTSSCAASAWTSAQTGRPNSSPVLRAASGIVSATAAARNPGIAPNSRRQKRPKAPQPSRPTPSFVPDVSVLVDVFMALELSRKELRLRARHPAAAQENFVDSHGQSEVAFAFCHLLGTVRLMPRLKRIKYERLYLPAKGMVGEFPNLTGVLTRPIRGDLITQQYDEMVKAAVALKDGTATAEAILRRFNSYNVTHPTSRLSLCECAHDCTATHGELSARVSSGRSDAVLHILFDCVADLK